jgi:hypothetical protein
MTQTVIRDHAAGLQFRLPSGWSVDVGDLMGPFTAIAARPRSVVDPDDPELWEVVALGVFDGTDDPPTTDDLLGIADWIGATNAAVIGLYPEGPLQSQTRDQRLFDVGGCAAAEITYAFAASGTSGYQRVVVIHQSDGRTSFAVGVATQPADHRVVDTVLGSVTPLP